MILSKGELKNKMAALPGAEYTTFTSCSTSTDWAYQICDPVTKEV